MDNIDKYLNLIEWLKKRYKKNGEIILSIGNSPSTFKKLELGFFKKYIA